MAVSENSVFSFFDKTKGLIAFVFLLGLAVARIENTSEKQTLAVQVMFEKYVIKNEAEKERLQTEIAGLKNAIDFQSSRLTDLEEFVKPEEPKIKPKNYR